MEGEDFTLDISLKSFNQEHKGNLESSAATGRVISKLHGKTAKSSHFLKEFCKH